MTETDQPWYRDGLQFECSRCGHCCTGPPGVVWTTPAEVVELAAAKGLDVAAFSARYLREVEGRLALVERTNGDCIFWDQAAGCTVYAARPEQCRTWPFWPKHLATPEAWERTQRFCPGARHGRVHSLVEIESLARRAAEALG